ncbi:MAG: transketolase [Acidobacteria bacterium]|nr:MAG: transketolase [Acidobacteriota bacterium]
MSQELASVNSKTETTELENLCINTIRFLAVDAVEKANSGHPGTPMEAACMAYEWWTKIMRYNPKNPHWPNRDRFVLSAGHASMLLYSMLHLTGYDLSLDQIKQFRQFGSQTPGHPEYGHAPGVETTTGPLGQGFGTGVGMAIAERFLEEYFNRPGHNIVDYYIYAYCSDGDVMEGISHEAASLAGHLKLNKLIYVYSDNHITIDGNTAITFTENERGRFEAYGWFVQNIEGNDRAGFLKAIENARAQKEKPSLIIARTHIGYGSPGKQDKASAHGAPLGADEVKRTKENLGWPLEPTFYIPDEVLKYFRQAIPRGAQMEAEWNRQFDAYAKAHPDLAAQWERFSKRQLPDGWQKAIPDLSTEKPMATRQASGKVLNAIGNVVPNLIVGSADLAESTNVDLKDKGSFGEQPCGRNIHFGVREHAMAAILNGITLSGMMYAAGGTFFIFSDYMRPAVRIAALMNIPSIFVYTHDSIGLGEDGPTHQPIEHLASLRAMPNLTLLRPADATETAVAWEIAMDRKKGPVALVLTRQKLPIIDRKKFAPAELVKKGGYVLAEAKDGKPELILISTGSEVTPTMQAWEKLTAEGIATRVVSMPSWELFGAQPAEYKQQVLPPSVWARVAVEAASEFGWKQFVGDRGIVIGMETFGASAPGDVNMEKFGFTAENIASHARQLLGK